jgi:hypothetical protein
MIMNASQLLLTSGKIGLEFIGVVFAADFVAGFIHWVEDAYGHEDTPIIGKWFIQANLLHHREPRAFVKKNWWQSSWDLTLAAAVLVLATWLLGCLHWPVILFALLSANANEIHKWAHRTPRENGRVITWLQRLQLVQNTRHHAKHHTNPKDSNYCTITNFLNPILDGAHFWEGCEFVLLHTIGLRCRIDPTVAKPRPVMPINIIPLQQPVASSQCNANCRLHQSCRKSTGQPSVCPRQARDHALIKNAITIV